MDEKLASSSTFTVDEALQLLHSMPHEEICTFFQENSFPSLVSGKAVVLFENPQVISLGIGRLSDTELEDLEKIILNRVSKALVKKYALRVVCHCCANVDRLVSILTYALNEESIGWQVREEALNLILLDRFEASKISMGALAFQCSKLSNPDPVLKASNLAVTKLWCGKETVKAVCELNSVSILEGLRNLDPTLLPEFRTAAVRLFQLDDNNNSLPKLQYLGECLEEADLLTVVSSISQTDSYWGRLPVLLRGYLDAKSIVAAASLISPLCRGIEISGYFPKSLEKWYAIPSGAKNRDNHVTKIITRASNCLECLQMVLKHSSTRIEEKKIVFLSCIGWTALEQKSGLYVPWKSSECKGMASAIVSACICPNDLEKIISNEDFWVELRKTLGNDQWKTNKWQTVASMLAILRDCKREVVFKNENILGHVIPLLLPLIDELEVAVSEPGLFVLHHIVEEMTTTEIRWHSNLLLEKLFQVCSASRDPRILHQAIASLLAVLRKAEPMKKPFKLHCEALERLLPRLLLAIDHQVELEFTLGLTCLVKRITTLVTPYLEEVIKCCEKTCEVGNAENAAVRVAGLKLLQAILVHCDQSRIRYHQNHILAILAKHRLMFDTAYRFRKETSNSTLEEGKYSQQVYQKLCDLADRSILDRDIERLAPHVQFCS